AGLQQLAVFGGVLGPRRIFLPLDAGIQCPADGLDALGDLAADAVARDQNCFHKLPLSAGVLPRRPPQRRALPHRGPAWQASRFFIQTIIEYIGLAWYCQRK